MPSFERWEDELYHHGILGMRWGIRRYQNEDGSWTAAGLRRKARLDRLEIKQKIKTEKANIKASRKINTIQNRVKNVKKLSDEELKARISRLNLEKQYKELEQDISGISNGKAVLTRIFDHIENKALNEIKEKELYTRRVEAKARVKQAEHNAEQANYQAVQARRNAERDETNKKVNIIKAKNERKKIRLLMKNAKKFSGNKYKDYMAGKISIDELLGLNGQKKDDS